MPPRLTPNDDPSTSMRPATAQTRLAARGARWAAARSIATPGWPSPNTMLSGQMAGMVSMASSTPATMLPWLR